MRMVLSWGQLIWVFFPIPIFCLALLSLTWPRNLERIGARTVSKIFFTEITAGPVHIKLLWLFSVASGLLFLGSVRALHRGAAPCRTCVHSGEMLWYTKAMKFRAERNFWLSLFNGILWFMVWTVHRLRKKILTLKDRISEMEGVAQMEGSAGTGEGVSLEEVQAKSDESKKRD